MAQPLKDILVLDFSTLLPGPMATLMLAEAGAEVVKFERPVTGEDARHTDPKIEGESIGFAVLNQGKRSVAIDLKAQDTMDVLRPLLEKADVLVIIVSEETGYISYAKEGRLYYNKSADEIRSVLRQTLEADRERQGQPLLRRIVGAARRRGFQKSTR